MGNVCITNGTFWHNWRHVYCLSHQWHPDVALKVFATPPPSLCSQTWHPNRLWAIAVCCGPALPCGKLETLKLPLSTEKVGPTARFQFCRLSKWWPQCLLLGEGRFSQGATAATTVESKAATAKKMQKKGKAKEKPPSSSQKRAKGDLKPASSNPCMSERPNYWKQLNMPHMHLQKEPTTPTRLSHHIDKSYRLLSQCAYCNCEDYLVSFRMQ